MILNATLAKKGPSAARCRGATLIEVLIAVVVLAIGLLGYAALQSTSLKAGHSAQLRSQATWLAYDIADRLRACRKDGGNGEMDASCEAEAISNWEALVESVLPITTPPLLRLDDLADSPITLPGFLGEDEDLRLFFMSLDVTIFWDDGRGQIRGGDGVAVDSDDQSWSFSTEI